jgi:hypothetical protein
MLRRVVVVRTDVSEELIGSIIRATKIGEIGTMLTATQTEARCEEILLYYSTSLFLPSMFRLLVTASVVPSSLIPLILVVVEL